MARQVVYIRLGKCWCFKEWATSLLKDNKWCKGEKKRGI